MAEKTCRICGCELKPKAIVRYPVVPAEIIEQAGIQRLRTVRLCSNCCEELQRWYETSVSDMTYDTALKRFTGKSPLEMVREYEAAYRRFARYKKEQKNIA
jgi:hypothetical protein